MTSSKKVDLLNLDNDVLDVKTMDSIAPIASGSISEVQENTIPSNTGRNIAEQMLKDDYHPVIIFGSKSAGKSVFVASLIAMMKRTYDPSLKLGSPLYDIDTSYGDTIYKQAKVFYNQTVQEYINGAAMQQTDIRSPFFIPLVVTPAKAGMPEKKFALLESQGEWYQPNPDTSNYFPALKQEIEELLRHYTKAVSFIHVAPVTQGAIRAVELTNKQQDANAIKTADESLQGALNNYQQIRTNPELDNHIFLVTKWDAIENKQSIEERLECEDNRIVEEFAKHTYPLGFAAFMQAAGHHQKVILQYCAGLISNRSIVPPNDTQKPILEKYPKVVWNLLYRNALEEDEKHVGTLYTLPLPVAETLLQKIRRLIGKVV